MDHTRTFIAIGVLFLPLVAAEAVTIRSNALTGNWSAASSWQRDGDLANVVPTSADAVIIQAGHAITVDTTAAEASTTTINNGGVLKFSRSSSSALTLSNGDITVNFGGTLDMGDAPGGPLGGPIPSGVKATLVLARGNGSTRYRLLINQGGIFTSRGEDKDPVALAQGDLLPGALQLDIAEADAQGWAPGDTITIGQTQLVPSSWRNETEERVIAAISPSGDPRVVTWVDDLDYFHTAANGIRVANLTRNVVVRSSGTDLAQDAAHVRVWTTSPTGFRAALTEFAYLGNLGNQGVVIDVPGGGATGSASSCTFRNGGRGVYALNGDGVWLTHNVFYANRLNVGLSDTDDAVFSFNDVIASSDVEFGASISGPDATVASNAFYSNPRSGVQVLGTGHIVENNRSYGNGEDGFGFPGYNGSAFFVSSNTAFHNTGVGFYSLSTSGDAVINNTLRDNGDGGLYLFGSQDGFFAGNRVFSNQGTGVTIRNGADRNVFLSMAVASNSGWGMSFNVVTGTFLQEILLGYDATGAPAANGSFDMAVLSSLVQIAARDCRFNVINFGGSQPAGNSLVSYNQDFATGTVRVYGEYALSGGMTLDRAQMLYRSTATTPRLHRGSDHSALVVSTDDNAAVTQVIVIKYEGGQWRVEGSSTGVFSTPHPGNGSTINYGQFQLQLIQGSPQEGDRLAFGLMAASKDAGRRKQLLFANANNLTPRLTAAPGSSLTLRGTSAEPTLVDRLSSGEGFYSFVSSGSLTMENVRVEEGNAQGIQVSGSGGVAMSSVTFDNLGGTGAYVTARDLTSSATFYNIVFDDPAINGTDSNAPFSVSVQGADSGLRWFMASGFSGNRAGDAKDSDPNQKVLWADTAAPNAPGGPFSGGVGANEGEITLTWTAPADNESAPAGSTSTLRGGSFLIFRTTTSAALAGATTDQAQIPFLSTTAVAGSSQFYTDAGLLLGTTYYYKLWAGDEFGNRSAAVTAQALPRRNTPLPPSNFAASASSNTVTLSWTAPSDPPAGYLGGYRLEYSTVSGAGPYSPAGTIPASSTTHAAADLQFETTYYFRLYSRDTGTPVLESASSQGSARTAEITDPAVSLLTIGASAVGVAWTGRSVALNFTKMMNMTSVTQAVRFVRVKDNMGNAVNEDLTGTVGIAANGAGDQYTITFPALSGNSTYEVGVATTAGDNFGKYLASSSTLRFTTLMDHTQENVVTEGVGGAVVRIPPNALAQDGYMTGAGLPEAQFAAATRKLSENADDPYRRPLPGTVVDLDLFDDVSIPQPAPFAAPLTVSLPFTDGDGDGVLDFTSPPVRVRSLAVYWLDEAHDVWVPLASTVDPVGKTVSAPTAHFTTFALMAQSDLELSGAHPFPIPYTPGQGTGVCGTMSGDGICFTGLPQTGAVRIYTPDGRLVRDISIPPGGQYLWDVRNAEGEDVSSGVYLYEISNGRSSVTGKLAVIR